MKNLSKAQEKVLNEAKAEREEMKRQLESI